MNNKSQIGMIFLIGIIAIIVIGGLFALGVATKLISLPIKTFTNQVDSASEVIDKTYDADNAIYNYEWFKTQFEKINANRQQIQNLKDSLVEFKDTYGNNATSWDYETKQEYNRLSTIKTGLQNQDENLVAEYNARSKMANREIFKDKLPLSVDRILW